MTCKHCGSDKHTDNLCPTLNLVKFLLDEPYDEKNLPDLVTSMDANVLFAKSEEELHDEVKAIRHLKKKGVVGVE
jgi:hypothetical protein